MRIRAERDDLASVLGRAARVVGTRSPMPILQGVLCEVTGNTLRVTGTDLDMTVRTSLEVEAIDEGSTVIQARYATGAVPKLPAGAVTVEATEGHVEISGGGPKFRFRELPVEDFPKVADPDFSDSVKVDGKLLADAIAQVGVAASTDDARPILTGISFEHRPEGLRMVATDSYRLAVKDIPAVTAPISGLIPVRALGEIDKTIGAESIDVAIGAREAAFRSERGTLSVRLIEGTFPQYEGLIPASTPNRLVVDRDALLEAIDRASLVAEDHIPVRLKLQSGGLEVSVTRQDVGGETEYVEAKYEGEEMTIAFNSRYLNDGVKAIRGDHVQLDVVDPLKPGLLRASGDSDFLYLLMPVRL